MFKKIVIVAALVVAIFGIHQMFTAKEVTHGGYTTVTFTGVRLDCPHCQTKARRALANLVGVRTSHVFPNKDMIRVTFNSNVMKTNWISHSLRTAGFKPGHVKTAR